MFGNSQAEHSEAGFDLQDAPSRNVIKITPSDTEYIQTGVVQQLRSLHKLNESDSESDGEGALSRLLGGGPEPSKVELLALSQGENDPVELYCSTTAPIETVADRFKEIYPDNFDIEYARIHPEKLLVRPHKYTPEEFIEELTAGNLQAKPNDLRLDVAGGSFPTAVEKATKQLEGETEDEAKSSTQTDNSHTVETQNDGSPFTYESTDQNDLAGPEHLLEQITRSGDLLAPEEQRPLPPGEIEEDDRLPAEKETSEDPIEDADTEFSDDGAIVAETPNSGGSTDGDADTEPTVDEGTEDSEDDDSGDSLVEKALEESNELDGTNNEENGHTAEASSQTVQEEVNRQGDSEPKGSETGIVSRLFSSLTSSNSKSTNDAEDNSTPDSDFDENEEDGSEKIEVNNAFEALDDPDTESDAANEGPSQEDGDSDEANEMDSDSKIGQDEGEIDTDSETDKPDSSDEKDQESNGEDSDDDLLPDGGVDATRSQFKEDPDVTESIEGLAYQDPEWYLHGEKLMFGGGSTLLEQLAVVSLSEEDVADESEEFGRPFLGVAHTPYGISEDSPLGYNLHLGPGWEDNLPGLFTHNLFVLQPPEAIPEDDHLTQLKAPTVTEDGHILARPGIDSLDPHVVRWEGAGEKTKDWMTSLSPSKESDGSDSGDKKFALSPLSSVFEHLTECTEPTAYQVVFQPKEDWSTRQESRIEEVKRGEDGNIFDEIIQDIFPETDIDEINSEDPPRVESLRQKNSRTTFETNVRALSLAPNPETGRDPKLDESTNPEDLIVPEMRSLTNLLDPLDGDHYFIDGRYLTDNTDRNEATKNFFWGNIATGTDDEALFEYFDDAHWPELILSPKELTSVFLIPPAKYLTQTGKRGIQSKHIEQDPLPKPKPGLLSQYKDEQGVKLGFALDDDRSPDSQSVVLPENKLNEHYLRAASTGHGKSIGVINDLISLREATNGPNVLVDPKGGLMCYDYLQSHYACFGNLDGVYLFRIPEDLPAISFFDIRPQVANGQDRKTAIQDTVEHFHDLMRMIMGYSTYDGAFVAKEIISYMLRAIFDKTHGSDSFTFDEFREAVEQYHESGRVPKVGPGNDHIENVLSDKYRNSDDESFDTSMDAVKNRLNKISEYDHLMSILNTDPEWNDKEDRYARSVHRDEKIEKLERGEDIDEEPPSPVFHFQEVIDEDVTILFDIGDLRSSAQDAFSVLLLSDLWNSIQWRGREREDHDQIINLIIDEAASVAGTTLVYEELLPQGRGFGLSMGLVMQFPQQVDYGGDAGRRAYNEVLNNISTKLIGNIQVEERLSRALAHDNLSDTEIRNRIGALPSGEWVIDLPESGFGKQPPEPFSLAPLPIPPGHPDAKHPLSEEDQIIFDERKLPDVRNRTSSRFTIDDSEEDDGLGAEDIDVGAFEQDGEDEDTASEDSSDNDDSDNDDSDGVAFGSSTTGDDDVDIGEMMQDVVASARSTEIEEIEDLEEEFDQIIRTVSGHRQMACTSRLGDVAEEQGVDLSAKEISGYMQDRRDELFGPDDTDDSNAIAAADINTESFTPQDVDDKLNGTETDDVDAQQDSAFNEAEEEDEPDAGDDDDTSDSQGGLSDGRPPETDVDELADELEGRMDPSRIPASKYADYDIDRIDVQLLDAVFAAEERNLSPYSLLDPMKKLKEALPEADADQLVEVGLLERHNILRNKSYYTATQAAQEVLGKTRQFGDRGEKTPHMVGVDFATVWLSMHDHVEVTSRYEDLRPKSDDQHEGVIDIAAFDSDGELTHVCEVESASNNKDAPISDYKQLAEVDARAIWVVDKKSTAKDILSAIESTEDIPVEAFSSSELKTYGNMRNALSERDLPGMAEIWSVNEIADRVER